MSIPMKIVLKSSIPLNYSEWIFLSLHTTDTTAPFTMNPLSVCAHLI